MTAEEHPVQGLFRSLVGLRYPEGVTPTEALVEGPEFFPGGCGLWNAERGKPWPPMPAEGGVLVLGHNLDSIDSYLRNVATGGLRRGPTWSNLALLLDAAGVGVSDCFLTNFFMGCGPQQTGTFPGAKDPAFVSDCASILAQTVRILRPSALLVLGRHTWRHLGALSPLLAVWSNISSFANLDARGLAMIPDVTIEGAPPFSAVTVVHPSGATMGGNRNKRRYGEQQGLDAEAQSLRDALKHARLQRHTAT